LSGVAAAVKLWGCTANVADCAVDPVPAVMVTLVTFRTSLVVTCTRVDDPDIVTEAGTCATAASLLASGTVTGKTGVNSSSSVPFRYWPPDTAAWSNVS
jgi:hypothetical protein